MSDTNPTKLYKSADSRLLSQTIRVSDPSGNFERTYCFLCGKPCGYVSKDSSNLVAPEHIVVTCDSCDHDIIAKYGDLPFEKIPTHLLEAFGIVAEEKFEEPPQPKGLPAVPGT